MKVFSFEYLEQHVQKIDKVMMGCCMRLDCVYKEVWISQFAEARAEDAPDMDKTPAGSGRPSLGLKYS